MNVNKTRAPVSSCAIFSTTCVKAPEIVKIKFQCLHNTDRVNNHSATPPINNQRNNIISINNAAIIRKCHKLIRFVL